jgi:hypothetical protein
MRKSRPAASDPTQAPKFINPSKLKAVFDKMTEVESDPNSAKA